MADLQATRSWDDGARSWAVFARKPQAIWWLKLGLIGHAQTPAAELDAQQAALVAQRRKEVEEA